MPKRYHLRCSLYVSSIIEDLKREISECGTIDVLIKEIERITSQEEQEHLLIEKNKSMQIIIAELRKAIADKKTANEKEEERLTKKLILTRVNSQVGTYTNTRNSDIKFYLIIFKIIKLYLIIACI